MLEDMDCIYRLLAPKLDELGPPRETPTRWEEFMKRWAGRWQLMVTRFAEKRMEMGAGDGRGGLSSGGKFLCPECGDDVPTLRRLKCHRGKAHGVRRTAAWFVRDGVCPLLGNAGHGLDASGQGCEELQGGLDGRPAGGAHGGGAQRGGS